MQCFTRQQAGERPACMKGYCRHSYQVFRLSSVEAWLLSLKNLSCFLEGDTGFSDCQVAIAAELPEIQTSSAHPR